MGSGIVPEGDPSSMFVTPAQYGDVQRRYGRAADCAGLMIR